MMKIASGLFITEYDPSSDVLLVQWPWAESSIPEMQHALDQVVTTVRHFDIAHLLLDVRNAALPAPGQPDPEIMFMEGLKCTRVKKVALVVKDITTRDRQARQVGEHTLPYPFQTFIKKEVALRWLKA
ncbi:hypothetical protein [Pontibacter pamirensis]|uniref:hypothetical protein n=1 Tax=Pontibacter pamirensis TaxID=2562824 RepID=UPI0013895325|nr:hypothetical protein [Pontibacter pamirensis]